MGIKLINGDCIKELKKLEDNFVDLIVIDPPYNLHRFDYGNKSDFQEDIKYRTWSKQWIAELVRVLKATGSLYCWIDHNYLGFFQEEFNKVLQYKNTIIWSKSQGVSYKQKNYIDRYECCLFYTKSENYIFHSDKYFIPLGIEQLLKNIKNLKYMNWYKNNPKKAKETYERLKKKGKFMVNVWDDVGSKVKKHTKHLNEKPLELIKRCVLMSSNKEDLVLDCFMGSGTTGVVCNALKRNFIGIELEKEYYDISVKRISI